MSEKSYRLSLGFSCVGHTYAHFFSPIFYIAALSLESVLGKTHGEVVALIVVGNLLFGFAAPVAGWLGDRWSSVGMMAVYFLGMGSGLILTGFAGNALLISVGLALTGLFASIYHPVGIAWLVRNSKKIGTALGINGVFGNLGPAVAALMTGILIDAFGWRAAFIFPGGLVLITGLLFCFSLYKGWVVETKTDRNPIEHHGATRRDLVRVFMILAITMLSGGIIFQSTQPALPKAFSEVLSDDGAFGISAWIALIYAISSLMQIAGGKLADRFPVKWVYLGCHLMQIPLLILASYTVGSIGFVGLAVIMVSVNTGALPSENMLVAKYAPPEYRALSYGLKFVVAFGFAGLGVLLEGTIYDMTGGFSLLFAVLAGVAAISATAISLLPNGQKKPAVEAAE